MNGIWVRSENGRGPYLITAVDWTGDKEGSFFVVGLVPGTDMHFNLPLSWAILSSHSSEAAALRQLGDIQKWMAEEGTEVRKMGNVGNPATPYSPFVKTGENTRIMPRIYDFRERKVKEENQ